MGSAETEILVGGLFVDVGWDSINIGLFSTVLFTCTGFVLYELFVGLHYSKFAKEEAIANLPLEVLRKLVYKRIDSRLGWIIVYSTPAITYAGLFAFFAFENIEKIGKFAPSEAYSLILLIGWEMNFVKRCLESAFLHIYSDTVPVFTVVLVAFGYSHVGLLSLFWSNQVEGYEISTDSDTFTKSIICIVGFCVGMSVNFYSHVRLRNIRAKNQSPVQEKKYYSLEELGCLFQAFICPHYVFEILHFLSWGFFGGTVAHYLSAGTVFFYLSLRTRSTYQWYKEKGLIHKADDIEAAPESVAQSDHSKIHPIASL